MPREGKERLERKIIEKLKTDGWRDEGNRGEKDALECAARVVQTETATHHLRVFLLDTLETLYLFSTNCPCISPFRSLFSRLFPAESTSSPVYFLVFLPVFSRLLSIRFSAFLQLHRQSSSSPLKLV